LDSFLKGGLAGGATAFAGAGAAHFMQGMPPEAHEAADKALNDNPDATPEEAASAVADAVTQHYIDSKETTDPAELAAAIHAQTDPRAGTDMLKTAEDLIKPLVADAIINYDGSTTLDDHVRQSVGLEPINPPLETFDDSLPISPQTELPQAPDQNSLGPAPVLDASAPQGPGPAEHSNLLLGGQSEPAGAPSGAAGSPAEGSSGSVPENAGLEGEVIPQEDSVPPPSDGLMPLEHGDADLTKIKVKVKAAVAETGKHVMIEDTADNALKDVRTRIEFAQRLIECLGS